MFLTCIIVLFFTEEGVRCETPDVDVGALYKELRVDLRKDYDRNARPVLYHSNVTQLRITMHLMTAFEIDEEDQTLRVDSYMTLSWEDRHLTWDPTKYGGIKGVQMSPNDIWIPDVYEVQNGGPISDVQLSDFSIIFLNYLGTVIFSFATAVPGRCTFNYINYPSDKAECNMQFKAWTYKGDSIEVVANVWKQVDQEPSNSQWQIIDTSAKRRAWETPTTDFYPYAEFTLILARKTPILQQHLMWISSVMFVLLTLGMFWIPSDIEQKMTVGCVLMVIMTVLLVTVSSSIPARQPVIMIARIIHSLMYALTTAILLEIIAINLQHIQEWKPPEILLNIFSGKVGRILLISSAQQESPSLDTMKLSEYEEGEVMLEKLISKGNWKTVSQALDRVAFLVYVIILSVIPKTP